MATEVSTAHALALNPGVERDEGGGRMEVCRALREEDEARREDVGGFVYPRCLVLFIYLSCSTAASNAFWCIQHGTKCLRQSDIVFPEDKQERGKKEENVQRQTAHLHPIVRRSTFVLS
jgi:hypothetical protein